jgi:hypothetical protein
VFGLTGYLIVGGPVQRVWDWKGIASARRAQYLLRGGVCRRGPAGISSLDWHQLRGRGTVDILLRTEKKRPKTPYKRPKSNHE